MPFLYDVCNVKLQLCAKGFSRSRGGGTHLKKTFSISIKVNCRNYVFTPKILNGTFFLEENIIGVNEGIFKLLDSLIKKCF